MRLSITDRLLEGDRYGAESLGAIALQAATGLDVLVAGNPSRIAGAQRRTVEVAPDGRKQDAG